MQTYKLKKLSLAMATLMLLSLLVPVIAQASKSFFIYHNGTLHGTVYTRDASQLSVDYTVTDEVYTVTADTYGDVGETLWYDDDNREYATVTFNVYVGENPSAITVRDGELNLELDSDSGMFFHGADHSVTIDVYRMPGSQYFSNKVEDSYLTAGSTLFQFTPQASGSDALEIVLPHHGSNAASYDQAQMAASDLILRNVTSVTEDVYVDAIHEKQVSYNDSMPYEDVDHAFVLQAESALVAGDTYELVLTASSGSNEIRMPSSASNHYASITLGTLNASSNGVNRVNTVSFDGIVIANADDDEDEDDNDNPGNGSGSGNGNGNDDNDADQEVVNESSLKNGKNGKVAVTIGNGKKQVLLPAHAAKALEGNSLVLESEEITAEIPSEVLADLEGLLGEGELDDAQISFDFNEVTEEASEELLGMAKGKSKAELKIVGQVYDFDLSIVGKDGKKLKLDKFSKKIKLTLKYNEDTNTDLAGVYYISEDGELEFVGGKVEDGKLIAEVGHFSTYAVLEYDKQFDDVASTHWAADVIKSMAAKHVVTGKSDVAFQPEGSMTRAEFTAVIVRALGLEATGTAPFDDVAADAWYAGVVAAAHEAGLVNGKSASTFAPEGSITREEMATILVRAYELKTGATIASDAAVSFEDRGQASVWAQSAIDAALAEGLLQGKSSTTFAPKALLTRAEGAQIAFMLY